MECQRSEVRDQRSENRDRRSENNDQKLNKFMKYGSAFSPKNVRKSSLVCKGRCVAYNSHFIYFP